MLHFFRHRPVADQDIYAVWYTIIHTQAKTYLTQQMFSSITHTLTIHYFAASSIIDSQILVEVLFNTYVGFA